jgi:hypothetical protein
MFVADILPTNRTFGKRRLVSAKGLELPCVARAMCLREPVGTRTCKAVADGDFRPVSGTMRTLAYPSCSALELSADYSEQLIIKQCCFWDTLHFFPTIS